MENKKIKKLCYLALKIKIKETISINKYECKSTKCETPKTPIFKC